MKNETEVLMIGAGMVALVLVLFNAKTVAKTAVKTAENAAVGTVEGLGSVLGVPETNQTQCEKDKAAGDMWAASFSCPAADFLGAWWDSFGGNASKPDPAYTTGGASGSW